MLPEALLAAGAALDAPALVADGLRLLGWLLDAQTRDGHLSVVPAAGRGPFDSGPDSTSSRSRRPRSPTPAPRAHALTGQDRWLDGIPLCRRRGSSGANDAATPLYDPVSGGGCDGLERYGRNENQGAESTLALVSTLQQARAHARVARDAASPGDPSMHGAG